MTQVPVRNAAGTTRLLSPELAVTPRGKFLSDSAGPWHYNRPCKRGTFLPSGCLMNLNLLPFMTGAILLGAVAQGRADETEKNVMAQKKAAEANWGMIDAGEIVHLETAH